MDLLAAAENIANSCDRCGTCLTVCPLYASDGIERTAARGKNSIVRAMAGGVIKPGKETLKALDYCLLCRACVEVCPGRVQTDEAVIYARQYLTELVGGTALRYKLIGHLLGNRHYLKGLGQVLTLLRRWKINKLFPPGLLPDEYLLAVAGPVILGDKKNGSDEHKATRAEKVAYFEGCGMKLFFPAVAEKTKRLIASTAKRLLTPHNFCCGLPHLAHGMMGDFVKLNERNIAIFSDADIIVTDCASCGSTLKHLSRFVPNEEARGFAKRVMDLTEYLVMIGYSPQRRDELIITYHDPCHLLRGQGIKGEPRNLLAQAGELREMAGADVCCGGAGSFHLDYPAAARRILEKKRLNIEATGANMIVTACPGCMIQLSKLSLPVYHISQVI